MTYYFIAMADDYYGDWVCSTYTDANGNTMLFTSKEGTVAAIAEIIARDHKDIKIDEDRHDPENGIWAFYDCKLRCNYQYAIDAAVVVC